MISVQNMFKTPPFTAKKNKKNIRLVFEIIQSKACSNWTIDAFSFVQYTYSKVRLNLNYSSKKVFCMFWDLKNKKMKKEVHGVIWKKKHKLSHPL